VTGRQVALIGALLAATALGAEWHLARGQTADNPQDIPFSDLLGRLDAGDVRALTIGSPALEATLGDGTRLRSIPPPGYLAGNAGFIDALVRKGTRVDVRPGPSQTVSNVFPAVVSIALFGLLGFALYRTTSGRIPSLESKTRLADRQATPVTFADVAGVDEAKDEVKEIVDFLRDPDRFAAVGGRVPKGVLLVGPPGTGKTLLARSIAGEAGVPFLFACGADFVEMYAGVGASRVRRLFRDARRHKACIIFIDELDAVGRSRGSESLSHEEREQTLNQLLVELDGFETLQGIVIVAATNRPDILDPALLRAGRFDRQVVVSCPDLRGREAILRVHGRKVSLDPQADLLAIARGTPGFSGADLANLVNEAALLAARANRTVVTSLDLESARDKIMMGVERRSLLISDGERRLTAYHEAGHAVVAALTPRADPLHKVTIVPRGRALGLTLQLPESDRHTYTRDYLHGQIAVLMGGRAAEELFIGDTTSGAANDIERATEIAMKMVCEFGMSSLGPVAVRTSGAPWDADRSHTPGPDIVCKVDEEIRSILLAGHERARQVLELHHVAVRNLAEELLAVESLEAAAIRAILERSGAAHSPSA
jgi:cell division protease FtsH